MKCSDLFLSNISLLTQLVYKKNIRSGGSYTAAEAKHKDRSQFPGGYHVKRLEAVAGNFEKKKKPKRY